MEGDTTSFFIAKKLEEFNLAFSSLSRGISIGGELEYADEVTLGLSISQRIPYQI
jgi:recombination protein RecR